LYWAAAALFLSHFFSYLVHFLARGEYKQTNGGELMAKPYGRVVILHVTILLGGGLALATGENLYALVMLVLLKIAIDIAAHRKQHAEGDDEESQQNDRVKKMTMAFGGRSSGDGPAAFAVDKVGGDAARGFTIAALKPHPKFVQMPPWAQKVFKVMGAAFNMDLKGSQARGTVHKYLRSMTVQGESVPSSVAERIQNLGIRHGTTLMLLLDDETVLSYDYFANKVNMHGPNADRPHNIAAAIAFAESLQGFQDGVRIKASATTLENDLTDSLRSSRLKIT